MSKSLLMLITVAAGLLYLQQSNQPAVPTLQLTAPITIIEATVIPTNSPTLSPTQAPAQNPENTAEGSVPVDVVAELLMQPGDTAPSSDKIYRMQTAYTIAPARPRDGVIEYTIQQGDTLDKIAARFGITTDTIVWNNDDIYVNKLDPGDTLTILPENGILHKTAGDETI